MLLAIIDLFLYLVLKILLPLPQPQKEKEYLFNEEVTSGDNIQIGENFFTLHCLSSTREGYDRIFNVLI